MTELFVNSLPDSMQIRIMTWVVFLIMSTFIVLLTVWIYRDRQMKERLQELAKEVSKARDEVVNMSKMKNVFIQNTSHEIRTPLNAISGFSQLLAQPDGVFSAEEKAEFCKHIQNNTKLLTTMFDDILSIADIETGRLNMSFRPARPNDIARETMAATEYLVKDGVKISFETEVDDDFTIMSDSGRIKQLLTNFLSNASKYTDKGFVKLSIKKVPTTGMLEFAVSDSGMGVPKDKASIIFNRFTKVNDFTQGAGIGLSICQIIARKLNGLCYLDTSYPASSLETDSGARFVFSVPMDNQ